MRRYLMTVVCLAGACSKGDASQPQPEKATDTPRKLAGVFPDRFECESLTKPEDIAQAVGGLRAHKLENVVSLPKGVPQPCNYEVTMQSVMEYWTYDIDCRDGMKQRADALFAQYTNTSAELQHQYDVMSDAGMVKPTDAGVVIKRPEGAVEVQVGAKALDHHGQGLIFIDDDAPCYVRVIGPDASRRLAVAQLVAKNLTFMNAPMTPRPADQKP